MYSTLHIQEHLFPVGVSRSSPVGCPLQKSITNERTVGTVQNMRGVENLAHLFSISGTSMLGESSSVLLSVEDGPLRLSLLG